MSACAIQEPTEDELAKWIHIGELGKDRRLFSLIIELSFSKNLLGKVLSPLKLHSPVQGWLYTCVDNEKDVRHWFKICRQSTDFTPAERKFISALIKEEHVFFTIEAYVGARELKIQNDLRRPIFEISVHEWKETSETLVRDTVPALSYANIIKKNIESKLGETCEWKFRRKNQTYSFYEWFVTSSKESLIELFITRCIINFGLPHPRDVDAILADQNDRPVVLEFKRKYPAKGRNTADTATPDRVVLKAFDIDSRVSPLSEDPDEGLRIYNEQAPPYIYTRQHCFGLDLCHYKTVELCEKHDYKYLYLIWQYIEPIKIRGQKVNFYTNEKLKDILGPDLISRTIPLLKYKLLKQVDVSGFTRTVGEDSGAFTDGLRVQLTFDLNNSFRSVNLNPNLYLLKNNKYASLFLDVPYSEKDKAKELGAKWDNAARYWFAPRGVDIKLFERWWWPEEN